MFGVPQDVLSQLFALFSFVSEPTRRLVMALLVYAVVPVPVLFLLRRLSLIHVYRLVSLRFAFRRIWVTQRRRPKLATESAVRLVEETRTNPITASLCWLAAVGMGLWWWLAAIDGFDTAGVRADLGQRRPVMFGVPLTPEVRWSLDSDHAVLGIFVLCFVLTPILLGLRFRMVHAAMTRSRGRTVPPWYADVRFVLGFSAGLIALIIGDLIVWSRVALLIAIAVDVAVSAVLVRTVRLEAADEPSWIGQLASPAKASARTGPKPSASSPAKPRSLGLPWRPAPEQSRVGEPESTSGAPPEPAKVGASARMAARYRQLFDRPDAAAAGQLRGRPPTPVATPPGTPAGAAVPPKTAVMPGTTDSWASYAPPLAPLKPHDPRRIGSYALQGRLGVGGMSVVYAGRHRADRRDVAIKVMRDVLDDADAQVRLMREMEALASATGPYTVKIVTVGHDGVGHFLVMDRLFGPNLWDFVNRSGPITDAGALTHLAVVLAAGLADFHARAVTHRDLKPANVMLTDGGPVIVDLGIAKLADVTATMPGSTGFATLGYVAPETILGRGTMATADVWSWGCCLAYAASGQRLFPGEDWEPVTYAILNGRRNLAAMEAIRRISAPLADLVWAATEVDPASRPFNGSALLTRLPGGTRWPPPSRALGLPAPSDATVAL